MTKKISKVNSILSNKGFVWKVIVDGTLHPTKALALEHTKYLKQEREKFMEEEYSRMLERFKE